MLRMDELSLVPSVPESLIRKWFMGYYFLTGKDFSA